MNPKVLLSRLRKWLAETGVHIDKETAAYWRQTLKLEERKEQER